MTRGGGLVDLDWARQRVGTVVGGQYRLLTLIGAGGMGVVFDAVQLGLERAVAVKLVHADGDAARARVRREAEAVSRVAHPHVVSLYDVGDLDGHPYLVMERLRGPSLAKLLARDELPWPRAVAIAIQVLDALDAAHASDVIHCDLTPDNVIVERMRGGGDFVKLIDFGLARALGERSDRGVVAGTPEYLAP